MSRKRDCSPAYVSINPWEDVFRGFVELIVNGWIRYARALEERIAYLEGRLSQFESKTVENHINSTVDPAVSFRSSQSPISSQTGTRSTTNNALGEIVGFLTLGSLEAPAYVGSSSGLSLAVNLGEMVQATVWNKVLPKETNRLGTNANNETPEVGSGPNGGNGTQDKPARMEELISKGAEPPNEEMGKRILEAYINRLHLRYPLLDRNELWRLHEKRFRMSGIPYERLTKTERFEMFKLYLVYSIGASMMQLSEKYTYTAPEVSKLIECSCLIIVWHLAN